jgi:hypothetical protein
MHVEQVYQQSLQMAHFVANRCHIPYFSKLDRDAKVIYRVAFYICLLFHPIRLCVNHLCRAFLVLPEGT